MSRENPAATSASSPSGEMPTVTRPRQPTSASRRAAARQLGSGPSGVQETRAMPAARSRETGVGEPQAVGGHPGQQSALAGRLHAVATEPLQHLGVRTDPGQAGVDDRGGQPGVAGQRRRHREDGGDAAAPGGLDDAVDGQVGLRGRRRAEQHGVVGQAHVPGRALGLRVHRDGLDAQPGARPRSPRRRPARGRPRARSRSPAVPRRPSCVPPSGATTRADRTAP